MKLYNTLTRTKDTFKPLNNKKIKMYVCGITPYDTTHLGHAFTYVFYDTLVRFLRYKGYKVNYVQNVTDVDDDLLKRAREKNVNWQKLGNLWTDQFLTDMKLLNVKMPTNYVKATDSIVSIIRIIEDLLRKGFAYEKEGNVYFEISKFPRYGELSHLNRQQMLLISKERGGDINDPLKKDPLDFLLWQSHQGGTKEDEPSWNSPWGDGRPGWHIECSAMVCEHLGNQIDIHGGGHDLIFPHHESEIAQSESYTGLPAGKAGKKPYVKYWVHTAMLLYQGEKMAKSLGNLVMVKNLIQRYTGNVIRYVLLSHCYRLPWEFDEDVMDFAEVNIDEIKKALKKKSKKGKKINAENYFKKFVKFMEDDLNTPEALNTTQHLAKRILKEKDDVSDLQKTLKKCLEILGFNI